MRIPDLIFFQGKTKVSTGTVCTTNLKSSISTTESTVTTYYAIGSGEIHSQNDIIHTIQLYNLNTSISIYIIFHNSLV